MKRILVGLEKEREVDFDPAGLPTAALEPGTTVVLHGAEVHRVTQANGRLLVNGKEVGLRLENPRDRRRNGNSGSDSGRRDVKAAMPGKVVKVLAAVDQVVEAGTGLLILEAMKMQNEVRAPGAGRVAAVRVAVGDTVASGQVLVTLE